MAKRNMSMMNSMRGSRTTAGKDRAFGALSKLMKKMPAAQRNQIQSNLGNIFGVKGGGLGGQGRVRKALDNLPQPWLTGEPGQQQPSTQAGNAIQQVLANAGFTGPGWSPAPTPTNPTPGINPPPGQPGINPPGTPPVGINPPPQQPPFLDPPGFFPPPPEDAVGMPQVGGAATPQLNLGAVQGGTMGMNAQNAMAMANAPAGSMPPPTTISGAPYQQKTEQANQPPTLTDTVNSMAAPAAPAGNTGGLPAVPGAGAGTGGAAAGAGTAGTAAGAGTATGIATDGQTTTGAGGDVGAMGASSANKSPTVSNAGTGATSNSLINTGALNTPGVGLNQIQNTVNNSAALNSNPVTDQQMFQQTFNPMINMAGKVDIQNELATPGRSFVGGQYGQGGMAGIMGQQQANQAAAAGGQAAQQAIGTNLQHAMQGQQAQTQMDLASRQQAVQQANALMGPALSGAATGFNQGLGGMTRGAQFLGV